MEVRRAELHSLSAADIDLRHAGELLNRHGFLHIRGVLPPELISATAKRAEGLYAAARTYERQEDVPADWVFDLAHGSSNLFMLEDDPDDCDFPLIRQLDDSAAFETVRRYFGSRDLIVPFINTALRFQSPAGREEGVPWHQDGFGFPEGLRVVNCWTPIHPGAVGRAAPSMEIVPARLDRVIALEQDPRTTYPFLESRRDVLEPLCEQHPPFRLEVEPGDVFLFDSLVLHRTYADPAMSQHRISAEIRVAAATRASRDFFGANPCFRFSPTRDDRITGVDFARHRVTVRSRRRFAARGPFSRLALTARTRTFHY